MFFVKPLFGRLTWKNLSVGIIVALSLNIIACAPLMIGPAYFPVEDSRAALKAKSGAEDSFKKFTYHDMVMGRSIKSRIDRDDAVFEFKDGRSFYEAYILSEAVSSIALDVKSWQDRHEKWKVDDLFYVYPEFLFLDANKEEIGTTNGTPFIQESDFIKGRYLAIKRNIVLPRPAKYLILKASIQHIGQSVRHTAIVGGTQYSPAEAIAVTVPFNYEGTVEFSIGRNASGLGTMLAPVVDKKAAAANGAKIPLKAEQSAIIKTCSGGLAEKDFNIVMPIAQSLRTSGYEKEALTCFLALNKLQNLEPDSRKELNTVIGIMYEMGEGVPANIEEAKKYYKQAGLN